MSQLLDRIEGAATDPAELARIEAEVEAGDAPDKEDALGLIWRYSQMHRAEAEIEVIEREGDLVESAAKWSLPILRREVGTRLLEAYIWDPDKHPRDALGRFIKVIAALSKGEAVEMPDGTKVKRGPLTGTLSVHHPGARIPETFDRADAAGAAERALAGPEPVEQDEWDDEVTDEELIDFLVPDRDPSLTSDAVTAQLPPEALRACFDGFSFGGYRVDMLAEMDEIHQSGALSVMGSIHRESDGVQVGFIQRTGSITREGELEVGHATLNMNPEEQGGGFAAALQMHAFAEYRKYGVKRVRVATAEVGGYAWARAGFDFDPLHYYDHDDGDLDLVGYRGAQMVGKERAKAWDYPMTEFQRRISGEEGDDLRALLPTEADLTLAQRTGRTDHLDGKLSTPWEIASYGIENSWEEEALAADGSPLGRMHRMWLGKALMIGAHWVGAIRLDDAVEEVASATLHARYLDWLKARIEADAPTMPGPGGNLHFDDDESFWEDVLEEAALWDPSKHPRGRGGLFVKVVQWMRTLPVDSYLVGGAVRDQLLGREPKDADFLAAGVDVDGIKEAIGDTAYVDDLVVGEQQVGVRAKPHGIPDAVEIAPPRREVSTGPGRHDFEIVPDASASVEEDLARRDFTINAIAQNIKTGEIVDPYNGRKDIEDRVLRTISPDSFRDDPLRIMRGLVRVAKDGLKPDDETRAQMVEHAAALDNISAERIQMELSKLLMGDKPGDALRLARDTGALRHILPELTPAVGFKQESKYHDRTVDEHTFVALDAAAKEGAPLPVRLAVLLHDSGKPASAWKGKDGRLHYYENPALGKRAHEDIGAEITEGALRRLRYPRELSNEVVYLVTHHMFRDYAKPREGKARKFLAAHGLDRARLLLAHKRADMRGKDEESPDLVHVEAFAKIVEDQADQPTRVKDLKITGKDLIELGGKPGPALGVVLDDLLRDVVGNPALNNREWLLRMAAKRLGVHTVRP